MKRQVEALLFASGKFVTIETLCKLTDESSRKIRSAIKGLKKDYDEFGSSIMVVEGDNSWKFAVRENYLDLVRKIVSDTELPKSVIETLSVIAWRNPVMQSKVVEIRSNKAYEHISILEKLAFVTKEKIGRSYNLKLTEKFFEYFDISGGKDIRKMFKNVKGLDKELEAEIKEKQGLDGTVQTDLASVNDSDSPDLPVEEVNTISENIEKDLESKQILESEIDMISKDDMEVPKEKVLDLPVDEVDEITTELDSEIKSKEVIESEIEVIPSNDMEIPKEKEPVAQELIDDAEFENTEKEIFKED